MATISIGGEMVSVVDDDDKPRLSRSTWVKWYNKHTRSFYARRNIPRNGFIGPDVFSGAIYMHRVIVSALPGDIVDHINHDTLDNRRVNLRVCRAIDNQRNQQAQVNRTSRFKGVCLYKRDGTWAAATKIAGKSVFIGRFASEIEAAQAYDDFACRNFGAFALTNKSIGLLNEK